MAKLYSRINWVNAPLTSTPVGATLLNKMDKAIDDLDNKLEIVYNGQQLTFLGETTSNAQLTLPATFKELIAIVSNGTTIYLMNIPYDTCKSGNVVRGGFYNTSASNGGVSVNFTTSGSNLTTGLYQNYLNGASVTASSTTKFYYV